ncbi:T9SS type A sorting domain-containing protein [Hymenobacter sp. BT664]|uniref:T9SS type A sorting domain-containing protein n=1 Tax=Hymenobacter montanus TaxID=2771359 RepID=A0A927GKB2_9BACT|nr:T9SS type A sorting domain-containing protein [Hymenobacter montanus]MBD2768984.1 T9SS type A sorting domain-containing protein [Hymenobacter montanus]
MRQPYTASWRMLALTTLLGLGSTGVFAQTLNYTTAGASNVAGTYTDLGPAGTVITTPNNDDANSAPTPIGFTFNFNGTAFTSFVLNTNGFIKLGTVAPEPRNFFAGWQSIAGGPLNAEAETNLLLPLNLDLAGTATTEYRVATSGPVGARVTTVQWKNVTDFDNSPATSRAIFGNISFQIKLYETSNRIEFVYGPGTSSNDGRLFKTIGVGIKGSGNTATTAVLVNKPEGYTWNKALFQAGRYRSTDVFGTVRVFAFNMSCPNLPDAGRTFRFEPTAPLDAAVDAVYALGKTPLSPQAVRAMVRNVGTSALTNLPVTLNVTGATTFANTQIVASLAPGASTLVTFAAFTPGTTGTNTLTVTVPADGITANNSRAYSQQVEATTFAVADPTIPAITSGLIENVGGRGNDGAVFAVKYTSSTSRTVTGVRVMIADDDNINLRYIYATLLNSAGAIIASSAPLQLSWSDGGSYKTLTFNSPVTVAAGDFYVGVARVISNNPSAERSFYPIGFQREVPLRTGTFFRRTPRGDDGPSELVDVAPNQGASFYDPLYPGDIGRFMIEAVTTTTPLSRSAGLDRAVSVYPNPSTGVVKVDVRGANAPGQLNVQVLNLLGQQVYTTLLKDNFTNEVNLAGLANGVYLLQVQTGAAFTSRQVVITR